MTIQLLNKENISKNQVDTIEQFKVLAYLKKQFNTDEVSLYLLDRFTIKLVDKNNNIGYFKYNSKTKSVDFTKKILKIKKWRDKKMELNYTKVGDYLLPNLTINNQNYGKINEYGYLRLEYLKEHNKGLYTTLLMKDELTNHLVSVSNECEERLKTLMDNYRKNDNKLSEKSKENNQLEWVELMNNYRNCVEEIILKEFIYV